MKCRVCGVESHTQQVFHVDPRDRMCWRNSGREYEGCYAKFRRWATVNRKFDPGSTQGFFIDFNTPESAVLFDEWLELGAP